MQSVDVYAAIYMSIREILFYIHVAITHDCTYIHDCIIIA